MEHVNQYLIIAQHGMLIRVRAHRASIITMLKMENVSQLLIRVPHGIQTMDFVLHVGLELLYKMMEHVNGVHDSYILLLTF